MKWKADKILNLLIEFIAMTPNYDQWNEQYLQYNKPRLVRYQKIISLFYAFGLIKSIVKDKNRDLIFLIIINKLKIQLIIIYKHF
jgi:hypothetical protein